MTLPIRVHVPEATPAHFVMLSCFGQLAFDNALSHYHIEPLSFRPGKATYTLHCTRGAKPFVLRTLREFARIANDWE